jgi:hypothetical protein
MRPPCNTVIITIDHIGKEVQIWPSFIQRQSTRLIAQNPQGFFLSFKEIEEKQSTFSSSEPANYKKRDRCSRLVDSVWPCSRFGLIFFRVFQKI